MHYSAYCLAAVLSVSVAVLCLTLRRQRRQLFALRLSLLAKNEALGEAVRVGRSLAELFDQHGRCFVSDPRLDDLLFLLSSALPDYLEHLPEALTFVANPPGSTAPPSLSARDIGAQTARLGVTTDSLIGSHLAALNDPVLNQLWSVRSPSALAEMTRHVFFLSTGQPFAVTRDWTPGRPTTAAPLASRPAIGETPSLEEACLATSTLWRHWEWRANTLAHSA